LTSPQNFKTSQVEPELSIAVNLPPSSIFAFKTPKRQNYPSIFFLFKKKKGHKVAHTLTTLASSCRPQPAAEPAQW
jgi:hypothetical protein